jgi:hypothetical protein
MGFLSYSGHLLRAGLFPPARCAGDGGLPHYYGYARHSLDTVKLFACDAAKSGFTL